MGKFRSADPSLDDDAYTSEPTKLRIVREGDDEYPWVLDAYDPATGKYSNSAWSFATHAEVVSVIPDFIRAEQEA